MSYHIPWGYVDLITYPYPKVLFQLAPSSQISPWTTYYVITRHFIDNMIR